MEIAVTPQELSDGQLSDESMSQALSAIEEDGYVVLEDIVDHDHLDILRDKMTEDSNTLLGREQWGGAGRIANHLQQGPPPFAPYIFPDIVANPITNHLTTALLGAGAYNSFYNGNTNCPGSGTQPLHMDTGHLWPDMNPSHPTATVVVNFGLRDVTADDGAIELWPGTHLVGDVGRRIDDEIEANRRAEVAPIRGEMKKGAALIRDMRLWHRGVPNVSDLARHMIALVHNAGFMRRGRPLRYVTGCEEAFEGSTVEAHAEFVDEPFDYLTNYRGPNK